MIGTLLVYLLLGQTSTSVNISDPTIQSKKVTTTTSSGKVLLDVNCATCSASSGDGGATTVVQGAARDGGVDWPVQAKLWDGVDSVDVTAANALKVDGSGVTQPVSLTSTTVTGNVTVVQPTGTNLHVVVDSAPTTAVTGPLTDVQLRATPVPISGTVTANAGTGTMAVSGPLTDAELRASAVPVSLTSTTITGSVAVTNAGLTNLDVGLSTRLAESTFTGRWPAAGALSDNFANPTTTQVGSFLLLWDGATWDRAPGNATDGQLVNLGSNNDVTVTGSVTVSGTATVTQGTAAATAGRWPVQLTDGTDLSLVSASGALLVDGSATTQPISGTVTVGTFPDNEPVAQGTAASSANRWKVQLTDGTDDNLVSASGALLVDGSATTQPVSLTSTTITGTVASTQSGTWTVQPGNTPNTSPWLTTDTPRTVATANNSGTCVSVTASTTVLASNASRRAYGFKASEDNTAKVHCKLGATATTSNTIFGAGAGWSQDTGAVYTGVIDCIAASGTQSVCPYELN